MKSLRGRLGEDEGGFTLPEVLVTIMMMVMVLFAMYSIFDMGIRVFAFGNDKLEATENARLGLEKMARETRAAYPQSGSLLLTVREVDRIAFWHKPDDNAPAAVAYQRNGTTLERNSLPVVENVSALAFTYCEAPPADCPPTISITEEKIERVRISLTISVPGDPPRQQTLTTDVSLRNRQ